MKNYTSNKKSIQILVDLLAQHKVEYAVISPGSRNAPLIIALNQHPKIKALSIADERVAAFFALGMAQKTRKPVAIVSTSGSAVLNFAPAISEAFYQKIPLLVLTADRPDEMINQSDGQAIVQHDIFRNYIKKSFNLPLNFLVEKDEWFANRQINEAINLCTSAEAEPIHINIPLREPLYEKEFNPIIPQRKIELSKTENTPNEEVSNYIKEQIVHSSKIMILTGILEPDDTLKKQLIDFAQNKNVVILTETTSNLASPQFINTIDRVLSAITESEILHYQPDILITFGKSVISKRIKIFLRNTKNLKHWSVGEFDYHPDTYMHLEHQFNFSPENFMRVFADLEPNTQSDFSKKWNAKKEIARTTHFQYLKNIVWSDFKAYETIFNNLPVQTELQAANSSPVRYVQLFDLPQNITCHSNRGTSGIDGCTSTAAGFAYLHNKTTVLLTGDISFLYDSNALWNNNLSNNLKIILLNNQGGSIFRFIPGPGTTDELETFFETTHSNIKIQKLVEAFGLNYFSAKNEQELKTVLPQFYSKSNTANILEIKTPREQNDIILKQYFQTIKTTQNDKT